MKPRPQQLDLFADGPEPPALWHSTTSVEAARQIKPRAQTLRRAVLEYLRECGDAGATDEEMQHALEMNPSTQRPRRVELVEGGWVVDSGSTRLTRSGRRAVVWMIQS